jgi:hypothetical protein
MQTSLGDWSLEQGKRVTERILGLFLFTSEEQLQSAEEFAESVSREFCFARYPFAEFIADHPGVSLDASELPSIALLDRRKTKFRLIRNITKDDTIDRLRNIGEDAVYELNATIAARVGARTRWLSLRVVLFFAILGSLVLAARIVPCHSVWKFIRSLARRRNKKDTLSDA